MSVFVLLYINRKNVYTPEIVSVVLSTSIEPFNFAQCYISPCFEHDVANWLHDKGRGAHL